MKKSKLLSAKGKTFKLSSDWYEDHVNLLTGKGILKIEIEGISEEEFKTFCDGYASGVKKAGWKVEENLK